MQLSQESSYKYLFSIVMAIYNVEEYLEEAIKSVVNQTLSFEKHVQLILINDGSPDNSERICLKYQQKYPDNVVYVKKENGGVSSARNEGLKHVQGKYVNFLDPDDKLSENTLHEVFVFFEDNYAAVDVVAIPMFFFEGVNGPHILNNKFYKTRVIDIKLEYNQIQLSSSSAFIKYSAMRNIKFNENLQYVEDADLISRVVIEKCTLGVVGGAKYYCRKRNNKTSSTQNGTKRKEWYTSTLIYFSHAIIQYSLSKYNEVLKYIQYLVMYDLQWRLNIKDIGTSVMTEQQQEEYIEQLKRVLYYIDDEIIFQQKQLNIHYKMFALQLKYGEKYQELLEKVFLEDDVRLYFNNRQINSLGNQTAVIEILQINNNELLLEGHFGSLFSFKDVKIFAEMDGQKYEAQTVDRSAHALYCLGKKIKEFYGFRLLLPLENIVEVREIKLVAQIEDSKIPIKMSFLRFTKLSTDLKANYYCKDNFILTANNKSIKVQRKTLLEKIKKEFGFLQYLFSSNRIGARKAVIARLVNHINKIINKNKEIWLFLDRQDKADDNAEHLFKYAIKQIDGIKKYFIIQKDSKDYNRLKHDGLPVIPYGSYKHKFLQLQAKKVISSHVGDFVRNPFYSLEIYYRDLMDFDLIFLQHGITKDDVSNWLNKYNENIKMFVTAANLEYQSILSGNYYYDKNVVKLTGFPRYDNLVNEDKKQILIMPTWRRSIVEKINHRTGLRPYSETFKLSEYFKMYNSLINDERLITQAKQKGYSIVFLPHPNIQQQISDFDRNEYVEFVDYHTSYQQLFNESSMLITDFSSVAFDVAYLKKPVLYFQFDENHLDEGYFDYDTMGFGEVCRDYEDIIKNAIEYIKNDCKMKDIYVKRVEKFYAYTDHNNCKRVYESIKNL
ncbi:bifunctional glycosyltransferase/CDP-glycerol:glycerophosphate glycerophosphotransferase [Paenibacillus residui]|uniref:CDP-glycerol glycerophosphotransferase family protein n=1 Tax=Paenibacillus residui TaxID=629724 RepID=A0ABW3DAJ1_9BACL